MDKTKHKKTKKLAVFSVAIIIFYGLLYILMSHLSISPTDSTGFRVAIYKNIDKNEKIEKGQFYIVDLTRLEWIKKYGKGLEGSKKILFTKKIVCGPGDLLVVNDKYEFFCNGKKISKITIFETSDHRKIPLFKYNGVIPENKYFGLGMLDNSFDSRYIGLIDRKWIVGKIILPLF